MMTAFLFTLQTLSTCPLLGGQAVYKARDILSSMEHTVYDDKALCDDVNMVWLRTEWPKPNGFTVAPNPAWDFVNVFFEKDMPEATLDPTDSKGIQLQSFNIAKDTRTFELDLSKLSAGVYTLRLSKADGSADTVKLVVVKN